eukprot:COSAG02_NODE_11951_length_1626_cov_1.146693_2_plen_42_part_00
MPGISLMLREEEQTSKSFQTESIREAQWHILMGWGAFLIAF